MNPSPAATKSASHPPLLRLAEWCLWLFALGGTAWLGTSALSAHAAARKAARIASAPAPDAAGAIPQPPAPARHGTGAVIGRLEIASLKLSVPVLENYDPDTLKRGVGHVPGTAYPGGLGNVGLAGHRDTFLRALRNIKPGMEEDVVTASGRFRYRVDTTEIVTPDRVEVLDDRDRPELTLITCYPFQFIGAAPQRFIVHAHLLSLDPG